MRIARIVEADCIGCTKCLKACPVDAIVGAAGQMHSVLIEQCTGCEQCLPPCPVDCIELVEAPFAWDEDRAAQVAQRRERAREDRLAPREEADGRDRSGHRGRESDLPAFDAAAAPAVIRAAVERSRARRRGRPEAAADRDSS